MFCLHAGTEVIFNHFLITWAWTGWATWQSWQTWQTWNRWKIWIAWQTWEERQRIKGRHGIYFYFFLLKHGISLVCVSRWEILQILCNIFRVCQGCQEWKENQVTMDYQELMVSQAWKESRENLVLLEKRLRLYINAMITFWKVRPIARQDRFFSLCYFRLLCYSLI